ncbi:MAG TPA: Na+/H+ antiporter NhaA [Acidimicrobiales bacterium]|nr:Na+/H+ antiporter NhaA [Acidimicrobiales bacterium]
MPLASIPRLIARPTWRFLQTEVAGGVLLVITTTVALVWANTPLVGAYDRLWGTTLGVALGGHVLEMSLRGWVDNGLMTVFFLTVGLELKRELTVGELRDPRAAALPIIAALGGMVGSALVYVAFTAGTAQVHGWGIPMATDLAVALGVLSLGCRDVASPVKLFVLALAVADDLGSIVVLAIFYEHNFDAVALGAALGVFAVAAVCRLAGVGWWPVYALLGIGVWLALDKAGVSPTLAGVAMGLLAPGRPRLSPEETEAREDELLDLSSPRAVRRTVHIALGAVPRAEWLGLQLHPWSSFLAVPLFALANAGIPFGGGSLAKGGVTGLAGGVLFGKLVGKFVGVVGATLLAQRLGIGRLPEGMGLREVLGVGALAGIGLTVSFLVANLALGATAQQHQAKLAVLVAAVISAVAATAILRGGRRTRGEPTEPSGSADAPGAPAP